MPIRLYSRIFWLFVLVGHVLAASAWIAFMAGGFPLRHPQFWTNRSLPTAIVVGCITAMIAARRQRLNITRGAMFGLLALYVALAITTWISFPFSYRLPSGAAAVMAVVVTLAAFQPTLRDGRRWSGSIVVGIIVGLAIGIAYPRLLRSPGVSTKPSVPRDIVIAMNAPPPKLAAVRLRPHIDIHPGDGSANIVAGRVIITVHPLLTFISRSPDRVWTCFAPRALRNGRPRSLASLERDGDALNLRFFDDSGATTLFANASGDALSLEAASRLDADVYSHLNTFTEIHVAGHRKLSVAFSPCAGTPIALTPQDASPARFAYVDADEVFHVVEASSAEKGPFDPIAAGGRLSRNDPLTMTLFDEGRPIATIMLRDWARQASTALSPTAGWGMPQNAIEFSLNGASDRSAASFYITLAATSVGRGFDSVGHAAGTYVNRIEIAPASP